MRSHPVWRIVLCILLIVQMNAAAFAQPMMAMSQDGKQMTADEHAEKPCHTPKQAQGADSAHYDSAQHETPDASSPQDDSTPKPDCCKSQCQCHAVHTPVLLISFPDFAQSLAHPPLRIDLATPRALTRASDSFRPPI